MIKRIFLLLVVTFAFATAAMSQSANTTTFQLAAGLSKYGYAHKSPLALIQAAQIVKENAIVFQSEEKEVNGEVDKSVKKKGRISLDTEQLLADAQKYAAGDQTILALIEKVRNASARGSAAGFKYDTDDVPARGELIYKVKFNGGTFCEVSVEGDGDTELDLLICDTDGNVIVQDVNHAEKCYVSWKPEDTKLFVIKIRNTGVVFNNMTMYHN